MIAVEDHDDQSRIDEVTCGGTRIKEDMTDRGNNIHQWVRKEIEPLPLFDPRKEKETYPKARK
jgi:hypothetical protein